MPNAKRANMREGALAQLFRKTADERAADAAGSGQADGQQSLPIERAHPHPGLKPTEPVERPQAVDISTAAPRRAEVRSPQERLRTAFTNESPEPTVDPVVSKTPAPAPAMIPSDREDHGYRYAAGPAPVGHPIIRVVGVGGAGVNAVNRMIEAEITGVEFFAINTDVQSLQTSAAHQTIHIGEALTRGLGSGANPEIGRESARQEYDRIKAILRGSDMVFIAAGAGGGTGTGAAPVVAQIAREVGALTVGIVTRPFQFEGTRRRDAAEAGIAELGNEVDTLIVVPNNKLLSVLDRNTSMVDAFRVADDVLRQGVQGVSDLVTLPGLINLDFADVRTIMSGAGDALLGIGMGTGENRALEAAESAVSSPLLETSMEGARSILLSIAGGSDVSLWEINEAAKAVAEAAHPDANIIFGANVDETMDDDTVWITVVATGFSGVKKQPRPDNDRLRSVRPAALQDGLPMGEPRVRRNEEPRIRRATDPERSRSRDMFDVPEFLPHQ